MKKIASIILVLALAMLSLPTFVFAEPTVESVVHDLSTVAGLSEKLVSDENIILNFQRGYGEGVEGQFTARAGTLGNVPINGTGVSPVNGIINETSVDFPYKFLTAAGVYTDVPLDITFSFYGTAKMDAFLLAGTSQSTQTTMFTQEFAIFAGNDVKTLFADGNKVYHYTRESGSENYNDHYITFSEPVEGSHIGLRIYKGVTADMASINYSYFRAREIALLGEVVIPEGYEALNPTEISTATSQLKTDYNLLQDGYTLGNNNSPATVGIGGSKDGGTTVSTQGSTTLNMIDGEIGAHSDIRVGGGDVLYMYEDAGVKKEKENVYTNITANLRHSAKIDKLLVALPNDAQLRAQEYYLYASDDVNNLYTTDKQIAKFVNPNNSRTQVFVFDEPITAKYVGIRITKGVNAALYGYGVTNSYARISEFAVFGKYDVAYYNCKVDANVDIEEFEKNEKSVYAGKKETFEVPLSSGYYFFDYWTVNGEQVAGEIDESKNVATLTMNIQADSNIVANYYENTVSSFDREACATYESYILVDNDIVYDVVGSLGIQRNIISVSNAEGNSKANGDYLQTGDEISIVKGGRVFDTLYAVEKYDISLGGGLTVTDIVMAVEVILTNQPSEIDLAFFDVDDNGVLTVSDLTSALEALLMPAEKYDYSEATVQMKNLDYKPLGRSQVNNQGKLVLEMTSSGFAFSAQCYGDVYVNLDATAGNPKETYFTVFVDGKRVDDVKIIGTEVASYRIATNLTAGKHTFEIMKQYETGNILLVNYVELNGKTTEKPKNKDLYIEFVGDSITCGYGNLLTKGADTTGKRHEDGTLAYSTQTALMLDADYSMISKSGSSLINHTAVSSGNAHMPSSYEKVSHSSNVSWNFERKADIVVINLGTNDAGFINQYVSENTAAAKTEYFAGLAYDFAKRIIELNGDDVQIVFALGLMSPGTTHDWAKEAYRQTAQKLITEGYSAHFCDLPVGQSGGGSSPHPNVQEAYRAAEVLSAFIRTNVLAN